MINPRAPLPFARRVGAACAFALLLSPAFHGHSQEHEPVAKDATAPGLFESAVRNSQYALDVSSRYLHDFRADLGGFQNVVGLDYYTKITGARRDWATAVVQVYGARIDGHPRPPGFFEGRDDWELWPRILNINLHLTRDRSFNLKVGHYELPYGLEVPINSNGTLRQLNHGPNLGAKVDWGVAANGVIGKLQYEVGLSRGSGVELNMGSDSYIVAGRVGTVTDRETIYGVASAGLSFMRSEISTRTGDFMRRRRVGIDGQYYIGPFGGLAEISTGTDNDRFVVNSLLEANIIDKSETLLGYAQYRHRNIDAATGWDQFANVALGIRWAPKEKWALSGQIDRTVKTFGGGPASTFLQFQARYRF